MNLNKEYMMPRKFEWEDRLSVGVEQMDNEHKKIVDLINDLYDAMDNDSNIPECFTALATFVVEHFEHEEKLMEANNFPDLDTHKIIHKNLLEKVGEFGKTVESGELNKVELASFLKMWLTSHIMGIDKKYGETFGTLKAA